jgi:hypothetical protein
MKKMLSNKKDKKANEELVTEKEVSDLKIKKLTLKTGVKAGEGTGNDACNPCTCHTSP